MADAPNRPTEKPGDGRGVIRWAAVYEAMTGATAPGGHHEEKPGVHADSLQAGHEPDKFAVKGIVMVPVLIVIVTGITYLIISGLFSLARPGTQQTNANTVAQAAERNREDYNDRVKRISSTDPKAEVPQPRLEYIRELARRPTADGGVEPEYVRSFKSTDSVTNSPEIIPQDLYPDRYVEMREVNGERVETRPLFDPEWVDKGKNVARIPVDTAIKVLLTTGGLKSKQGKPPGSTADLGKLSNGGQALGDGNVKPAEGKKPDAHDHKGDRHKDEHKPGEKK